MRQARGNKAWCSVRAAGMAPNCGVTEIQVRVQFARRRWDPSSGLEKVPERRVVGGEIVGGGLNRRGRFASWGVVAGVEGRTNAERAMAGGVELGMATVAGHFNGL
jgi:hypothetical protein